MVAHKPTNHHYPRVVKLLLPVTVSRYPPLGTGPNVPPLPQAPLPAGADRGVVLRPPFGEATMETCRQENRQGGEAASVHGHAEGQISANKVTSQGTSLLVFCRVLPAPIREEAASLCTVEGCLNTAIASKASLTRSGSCPLLSGGETYPISTPGECV